MPENDTTGNSQQNIAKLSIQDLIQIALEESAPFQVYEAKALAELLLEAARKYEDTFFKEEAERISKSGPCLICQKHTKYGRCSHHLRHGDRWLNKIRRAMTDPRLFWKGGRPEINGYSWGTVGCFVCDECEERIDKIVSERLENEQSSRQASKLEYDKQRTEELHRLREWLVEPWSPGDANYRDAWGILIDAGAAADVLAKMPYRSFLCTRYWALVRAIATKKANYKCNLCFSKGLLNVHHKTYEHRGYECRHLDDLTVLCVKCHAKFHDKLPVGGAV